MAAFLLLILGAGIWCGVAYIALNNAKGNVTEKLVELDKVYACCREYDRLKSAPNSITMMSASKHFNITNLIDEINKSAGIAQSYNHKTINKEEHADIGLIEEKDIFTFTDITRRDAINIIYLIEKRNDPHVAIRNITLHSSTDNRSGSDSTIYKFDLSITLSHFTPIPK